MSDHEITVTLKADANGCLSVIKQVTRSVDELSGKKVGNAGMPDLGKGAKQAAQGMREAKSETDALASSIGKLKGMIAGAFTLHAITSFGKKLWKPLPTWKCCGRAWISCWVLLLRQRS